MKSLTMIVGLVLLAGAQDIAYAQQYTGAGSTTQPRIDPWMQNQLEQQRAREQARANAYYYQPAPPRPTPEQQRQQADEAWKAMQATGRCVKGAFYGAVSSGPAAGYGAPVGCAAAAAGAPLNWKEGVVRALRVEDAY